MTQTIDQARLEAFVGRVVEEVGAAYNTVLVAIGDELGLYDTLAAHGPLSSEELAAHTGSTERYVREWLAAQAASGFLPYHAESESYELPPEQAAVLAGETSPVYLPGLFQATASVFAMAPRITEGFRTGQGVGWHEHGPGCSRAPSDSSAPATGPTSSRHGSPRWAGCRPSCTPGSGSPTSAAGTVLPPS